MRCSRSAIHGSIVDLRHATDVFRACFTDDRNGSGNGARPSDGGKSKRPGLPSRRRLSVRAFSTCRYRTVTPIR